MVDFLDWESLKSDVTEVLGGFQTVTLRTIGDEVYDVTTGTATPTYTDTTASAAVFDYTDYNTGAMLQDGTLAQSGDRKLLLAANGGAPSLMSHVIFANGEEWIIRNIKPTDPVGIAVLYECRIRN